MLVHVQCQLTGRRYLVDMGATFSLIPHKSSEPQARHPRLIGPGGQPIRCWGEERLQLQFSGRLFMWPFIKAEVTFPIPGVAFLRANRLSVSVATNQLTDDSTGDTSAQRPYGLYNAAGVHAGVEQSRPPSGRSPRGGPRSNLHGGGSPRHRPPGSPGSERRRLHLHQEAATPGRCPRGGR